jgi:plastocyanin
VNPGRRPSVSNGMRPHAMTRPLVAALFATMLVLGAAGCGDDEDEPEATGSADTTETTATATDDPYGGAGPGPAGSGGGEGEIVAKDFELSDLTVGPGEEIVLKNEGAAPHTATADDGSFDLEADGGATSEPGTAPDEPGTYELHCEIHSAMTATLTVEG